jgi:hypothetical protein
MSDKALIDELRALRKEVKSLREDTNKNAKSARDSDRYERYCRLKEQGKLSLLPALGRGMPRVPKYSEWDGRSCDDPNPWANDRR